MESYSCYFEDEKESGFVKLPADPVIFLFNSIHLRNNHSFHGLFTELVKKNVRILAGVALFNAENNDCVPSVSGIKNSFVCGFESTVCLFKAQVCR